LIEFGFVEDEQELEGGVRDGKLEIEWGLKREKDERLGDRWNSSR
jgi:hypothetical protein